MSETAGVSEDLVRSSYKSTADYGDILSAIISIKHPLRKIAEYGILDGYSLDVFARLSPEDCIIEARDIFEQFNGKCAKKDFLRARFSHIQKVKIMEGNFHNAPTELEDNCYDLIHVDIANTGDVYKKAEQTLITKLAPGGVLILEGGTPARDQVSWMIEYHKAPIVPEIERLRALGKYNITVLGAFPGITIIKKKEVPKFTGRLGRAFG